MIKDVDALEFLAAITLKKMQDIVDDNINISYDFGDICFKAINIENKHPNIQISLDAYSIESFRLKGGEHVTVDLHKIEINNMSREDVTKKYSPYLPPEDIQNIINEFCNE